MEALEAADADGECPRCSGTTIIYVCGKLESVNRNGLLFSMEEAAAFVAEEDEEGRCPVCGAGPRPEIVVGGWGG